METHDLPAYYLHPNKMGSVVRVAAVQAAPVAFDLAQSIEKVQKFALEAATAGADLVVFP